MFHVKCVTCKNFDKEDGCKFGLEDETCSSYNEVEEFKTKGETPTCQNCVWFFMNHCDFDKDDPLTCRQFKNKEDDEKWRKKV